MRGSIIKRYENSYSIILNLGKDVNGKRKQQWYSVKGTKKQAEKRLREMLTEYDLGALVKPTRVTVGQYLDQWLQDSKGNIAQNTAQTYAWFIDKHIKPAIGQIPLTTLRPEHLQKLYSDKLTSGRRNGTGGLGSRSVRYIHTTMHKALKSAVKMGMLARNPADAVDIPKVTRREMQVMSETDLHIFLEYAKSTPYYALFYTALFTGMRRSEILALRWCDLDLLLCQSSVTRTLHQLHNREFVIRQPKTAKGRRLIALSPSTVTVLKEHLATQVEQRRALGLTLQDDDLLFSRTGGKPLLPDSITVAWRKLARRCGLKGIRLHDARHTHASLMLKQGVHPKIVQERLGHASIGITLDTYSHVAPGLQQAAANRFDDIVLPAETQPVG
jgi:integrase